MAVKVAHLGVLVMGWNLRGGDGWECIVGGIWLHVVSFPLRSNTVVNLAAKKAANELFVTLAKQRRFLMSSDQSLGRQSLW